MTLLALRALGIGDLATAVPALRGLRAAYPEHPLVLAAPAWLAPLVALTGAVDRQLPLAGLDAAWPEGRTPTGALAVNLHGRGPQSHRLLGRTRPERLLGFACPEAGHREGPGWRADEHEVHRWCRLLGWYGVPADPGDLSLRRPDTEVPAGLSIVHPGAKAPQRRWPAERFAAVAKELVAGGHRVAVTGSPGEAALAGRVAAEAGLPGSAVLAGRTGAGELAALVAHARLVISGDTGIAHLATAYGIPSVVLFGPVPPRWWGPPSDRPWHRALWRPHADPRPTPAPGPATVPPHPALADIEPAEVLVAAEHALAAAR